MNKRSAVRYLMLVSLIFIISGCGQKGDLYFPEDKAELVSGYFGVGVKNGLF